MARYYEQDERRGGGSVMTILVGVACLIVLAGIGYSYLPKIRAAYESTPNQVQQQAPAQAAPAPVRVAPQPVYQPAPVIVQQVPAGEAPQPIVVQPQPVQAAPQPIDSSAPVVEAAPPPAPVVVINHVTSADGSHQTVTGSGACKVTKVAARCSR